MAQIGPTNPTNTTGEGEGTGSNYLAFALVLAFFFVGLTGVVVCHVLKKKGYRFTTSQEDYDDYDDVFEDDDDQVSKQRERLGTLSENEDTVGNIIQCIMKNEANSDALNAMVHHTSIDSDIVASPPLTPASPEAPRLSFDQQQIIGGETKGPLIRRQSQRKSVKRRPSEITVLSVGRFRVTKCDKSGKDLAVVDSEGSYQSASEVPQPSNVMTEPLKEESEDLKE